MTIRLWVVFAGFLFATLFAPTSVRAQIPPSGTCNSVDSCTQACDNGDDANCANLGLLYATGSSGAVRDDARAVALFRRACDRGRPRGCTLLATMYEDGRGGLNQDDSQAIGLYQRGCDGADGPACFVSATCTWTGSVA
jgi:TPR repeat protein